MILRFYKLVFRDPVENLSELSIMKWGSLLQEICIPNASWRPLCWYFPLWGNDAASPCKSRGKMKVDVNIFRLASPKLPEGLNNFYNCTGDKIMSLRVRTWELAVLHMNRDFKLVSTVVLPILLHRWHRLYIIQVWIRKIMFLFSFLVTVWKSLLLPVSTLRKWSSLQNS